MQADERLEKEIASMAPPLLILCGTADKVTRPDGNQKFFDTAGSTDKTLKLYLDHAHDLLSDVG